LLRGTSIGGARPKTLIDYDGKHFIAKFVSPTDVYPVVKAEYIAMRATFGILVWTATQSDTGL
jgi:serine/threonine-protein kinase HipA